MYLHLGEGTVISAKSIVAILDLENTTTSAITKKYLKEAQRGGIVKTISADIPKSAIICESKKENEVYISQISTSTLQKRALRK